MADVLKEHNKCLSSSSCEILQLIYYDHFYFNLLVLVDCDIYSFRLASFVRPFLCAFAMSFSFGIYLYVYIGRIWFDFKIN